MSIPQCHEIIMGGGVGGRGGEKEVGSSCYKCFIMYTGKTTPCLDWIIDSSEHHKRNVPNTEGHG